MYWNSVTTCIGLFLVHPSAGDMAARVHTGWLADFERLALSFPVANPRSHVFLIQLFESAGPGSASCRRDGS